MRITTLDLETDPFEAGLTVQPFASGYFDGAVFTTIWDADPKLLIERTVAMLDATEPSLCYVHNGGRFDIFYFLKYLSGNIKIINNRIVSCNLGKHELRDSYAIMPFPLASYQKDSIDYTKLHRDKRDSNRIEIIDYLRGDCQYLWELCTTFHSEFGDRLTIGGSSMRQLKEHHSFNTGGSEYDSRLRKDFYFGGRNQCFKAGVIEQKCNIYDVNSMYPHVMRSCLHPVSIGIDVSNRIEKDTCFVVAEGINRGAFPARDKVGLTFTTQAGRYSTTIHEWIAALETGTFKPSRIIRTYGFRLRANFADFIDHFYHARIAAKKNGDKARDLLYKFTLNSAYGKFAQNPENFFDYQLTKPEVVLDEACEHCHGCGQCLPHCDTCLRLNSGVPTDDCKFCEASGCKWAISEMSKEWIIWKARPLHSHFLNVATGASITGAARAVLLRGIAQAIEPLYCDTDSIIASGHRNLPISDTELGAWKIEATGDVVAIAGKKLYGVYSYAEPDSIKNPERVKLTNGRHAYTIKKAHKGVHLTGQDIIKIACGDTIEYASPVPAFQLDGSVKWIVRKVRTTA